MSDVPPPSVFDQFVNEYREGQRKIQEDMASNGQRLLQRLSDVKEELERRIVVADGNSMTRFNAVSVNVFNTEIRTLNLPTKQMVLDTVAEATAPITTTIDALVQTSRHHNHSFAHLVSLLDERFPQTPTWSSVFSPATSQNVTGGTDSSGGVTTEAPGNELPPRPHPLFPEIDMTTGQRIAPAAAPAPAGGTSTGTTANALPSRPVGVIAFSLVDLLVDGSSAWLEVPSRTNPSYGLLLPNPPPSWNSCWHLLLAMLHFMSVAFCGFSMYLSLQRQ
jgi:hypothetical protein